MSNLTGGCLCGAIRYGISISLTELRACHCRDCQKASGAHGAVVAIVPRDKLKLEKGTPKTFKGKAASGRTLFRYFCGECGSPLWSHRENTPEMLALRAGTLDDTDNMRITAHIWTRSARPWSYIDPKATQHAGQPEGPPAPTK